ncbi:hypothetical protein ACHAW5_001555 [Stephanodiscus triporus]|uniref:Eukaryotic translation initiation factor 3 subunit G n=1 Tax=Stephanodiscus triporus TaxID=2934178 RepID=A0ABD3NLT3_9STRA
MAPLAKLRWGDDADSSDDESVVQETTSPAAADAALLPEPVASPPSGSAGGGVAVPPTHTSRVDSKGIKVVTTYRHDPANPNRLIKTTTTIRVSHDKVRESVDVSARRRWKKFGQAAIDADQSNVTIHSRDDVYMEDPHADVDLQEEDVAKAISGNLNAFWAKQNMRNLQRKWGGGGGGGGAGNNKYVPPSARGGGPSMGGKSLAALAAAAPGEGGGDRRGGGGGGGGPGGVDRDQNTIRVTNISEDTTEADLQELFQPFGRISRVYLAKDKETMQSRGFAFVSFVHREDAASAMAKLQGHGYDHLILKLEWARPSAPKDPASGGTQFRSGYGKALAQDTKEKVSYASNLTTGVR